MACNCNYLLFFVWLSFIIYFLPHRWQPTRLPHPWDSPGKNIGVGCCFLVQCMKVKRESEVAQSCPTLSDPVLYCLFILDGMKICSSPSFKTKSRFFREEELYNEKNSIF